MDDWALIGLMAGLLTTAGYVPQIVKGLRTKRMDDVSLAMPIILGTGLVLWAIYGFILNNFPIIFWDLISLALVITMVGLKLRYRRIASEGCPVQGGEGVGQG